MDIKRRDTIVSDNIKLVYKCIKDLKIRNNWYEDAVSVGMLALVEYADKCDESKCNGNIGTYLYSCIRWRLINFMRKEGCVSSVSHKAIDYRNKVYRYCINNNVGLDKAISEIDIPEVYQEFVLHGGYSESLDAVINDDSKSGNIGDTIACNKSEEEFKRVLLREGIRDTLIKMKKRCRNRSDYVGYELLVDYMDEFYLDGVEPRGRYRKLNLGRSNYSKLLNSSKNVFRKIYSMA